MVGIFSSKDISLCMKVAIVSPMYFSDDSLIGGGERYGLELARALARQCETTLITFGRKAKQYHDGPLLVKVFQTRYLVRGNLNNPLHLSFYRDLIDFDIIHGMQINTVVGNIAQLTRHKKQRFFVTDLAGGGVNLNTWFNLVRRADGVAAISAFSANYFRERFHVDENRLDIVYAGVDTQHFRPKECLRTNKVIYVGRLIPHKGLEILIQAMPDGVPLEIYGRAYDNAYLQRLKGLASAKIVTFCHDADDEVICNAYASARLSVVPSLSLSRRPELFGLVAAEAMACETPVIVADTGSLSEVVVDGETGFVVPAGDVDALSLKIIALLDDRQLAEDMGRCGRKRVLEHFTWDRVATRHIDLYRRSL
jgi:glycosyltransferase involved in cell wall biosynthesis